MSISKRLRYEILRRDNHACLYCGATAPAVALTVDHVTPVALGGSDDPTNLATACGPCNSGKTSSSPDAPMVATVSQDALRWSAAMKESMAKAVEDLQAKEDYVERFEHEWQGWSLKDGSPVRRPQGWESSVGHWYEVGVPIEVVTDAVNQAMGRSTVRGKDAVFRYTAGIVWRTLDRAQDEAKASLAGAPSISAEDVDTYSRLIFRSLSQVTDACGREWAEAQPVEVF